MSKKNKELVKKINEAFSKGNTKFILANVADDIRWNIVGMPTISGKNDFLETMEMMELQSFPLITVRNIIAEGDYVVVESAGKQGTSEQAIGKTGEQNNPSYCDVYLIKDGKVKELTTYVVDTSLNC